METTALIISIVALAVAGLSVFYTRQQAQAAKDTASIERQRRLSETAPVLAGHIENMGGWDRMWLRIEQSEPLTRLDTELVDSPGVGFGRGIDGIDPAEPHPALKAYYVPSFLRSDRASLHVGDAACWRVELQDERVDTAHLRTVCHGLNGASWTVYTDVNVFPIEQSVL